MNHDSIKPRQHCNYGGVHLNTADSKVLAENFLLVLSRQTSLEIIQDNDALIENVSVTKSNFELAKNLLEDTLESKSDNHKNDENIPFPFLKKIKSEYPKNFFGQLNVNLIRNKFESVQEIIQKTFDIFLCCETKTDYSSFPNQQFCIPEYRIFRMNRNARGGGLLEDWRIL